MENRHWQLDGARVATRSLVRTLTRIQAGDAGSMDLRRRRKRSGGGSSGSSISRWWWW